MRFNVLGKAPVAAVLIFMLLMAPALALILTTRGGVVMASPGPNGTTYDFKGDENHRAWEEAIVSAGSLTDVPFVLSLSEAESGDYNNIENSDDVRWETILAFELDDEWNVQYFKFEIEEDADTIDSIEFLWEGYGPMRNYIYAKLYVWGNSGGSWSWVLYNEGTNSSDENLENIITSNMANFIVENSGEGQFWLAVKAQTQSAPSQELATDYVRVIVNYTPLPPPPVLPTQPTLYLPSDGDNVWDATPYFEWTNGENADNHRLLVDASPPDWSGNTIDVTVTENNYTPTSPLAEDDYSFKVVAQNENGENSSAVWTFNVLIAYPTQPTLYLPSDGTITDDNILYLEWTKGENAENHRLLVDDDSNFSSPVENRIIAIENFYFPSPENIFPDDNYSWKVISVNENGENESATWTFKIQDNWATPLSVVDNCGEEATTPATDAIDGSTATAWRHDATCFHWIVFDLGETKAVYKIKLYQRVDTSYYKRWGQSAGLTVYVSDNENDWGDKVWTGILDAGEWQESGLFDNFKLGRYIKLVSKNNSSYQIMKEFAVYVRGKNLYPYPSVTNESATNVGIDNVTLNASIEYKYFENVEIRFRYKGDYQCYIEPENENWSLSDHYYNAPTDSATAGDWGNRTPVNIVAAFDSSAEDKAIANWVCDGEGDEVEINAANDNLAALGGGKVRLCDGTYTIANPIHVSNNVSFVGDSKENTIIVNPPDSPVRLLRGKEYASENILVENLTFIGPGRMNFGEVNGIHLARVNHGVLKNLLIKDVPVIAIYFEGKENDVWVIGNEIQNTGHGGIIFAIHSTLMPSENHYILNNTIVGTAMGSQSYGGDSGIALYSVKHAVVANNIIENCGRKGIGIVHGGDDTPNASENILVQGNRLHHNCLLSLDSSATEVCGGMNEDNENYNTFDVIIRGNEIKQFYGIIFNEKTENCTIDNNNLYNTVISLHVKGSGHVIENNVDALIVDSTPKENITASSYSKDITSLYPGKYGFSARATFWTSWMEYENEGDWLTFETAGGVGRPQLYHPENNDNFPTGSITFEWTNGAGAVYHRLIVNDDQGFGGDNEIDLNFNTPENSHAGSLSSGQYWWKVIAVYGESENESDVWTFTLEIVFSGSGSGTLEDPYIIMTVGQLQEMKNFLDSYFALGDDIDASDTVSWNDGAGFEPIGQEDDAFYGQFDGKGYEIINLYINRDEYVSPSYYVGLFGRIADESVIINAGLENANITGYNLVGALAGNPFGTMDNCYSTGSVSGRLEVGGLVGAKRGTLSNSYSTATVSASYESAGGLVGSNDYGMITNSYSTGSVSGPKKIGGLAGWNMNGTIENSYSTSSVSSDGNNVGGLIGYNSATVRNSYSTGSVTGDSDVGGLVGHNDGTVSKCYSIGFVIGNNNVGGLVGYEISYPEPEWQEVENWINYLDVAVPPEWQDVESWINYLDVAVPPEWQEVETWINYLDAEVPPGWQEVGTWANYLDVIVPEWQEVETWINYLDVSPHWQEVGTWINYVDAGTGTVLDSFYDNQTSGQSDTGKGIGMTTTQMQSIATFSDVGWDIVLLQDHENETWYIDDGDDYPKLGWQWEVTGLEWQEVETWTNYLYILYWQEVGTWTNYADLCDWHEVGIWANYVSAKVTAWQDVGTWTNYLNVVGEEPPPPPPEWLDVETWTNHLSVEPPGWKVVAEWSSYLYVRPTGFISGDVTDIDLNPIEDAIITLLGTSLSTTSDNLGNYVLTAPIDNYDVEASAIGYDSATVYDIEIIENQTTVVNFTLTQPTPPPPKEFAWAAFIIRFLGVIGPFAVVAWQFTKIKDPVTGARAAAWALMGFVAFVILWFCADAVEAVLHAM